MTADSDDRTTEYGPPSFARPLLRPEPLPEPPEPAASGVDYWALSALVAVLAVLLAGATFLVLGRVAEASERLTTLQADKPQVALAEVER